MSLHNFLGPHPAPYLIHGVSDLPVGAVAMNVAAAHLKDGGSAILIVDSPSDRHNAWDQMADLCAAHDAPTANLALVTLPQAPSLPSWSVDFATHDGPAAERKAWRDAIETALPGAAAMGDLLIVRDLSCRQLIPYLDDPWFTELAPALAKMLACQVLTACVVQSHLRKQVPADLPGVRFELMAMSNGWAELALHLRKPSIEGAEPRKLSASWLQRAVLVRDATPPPIVGTPRQQPEPVNAQ